MYICSNESNNRRSVLLWMKQFLPQPASVGFRGAERAAMLRNNLVLRISLPPRSATLGTRLAAKMTASVERRREKKASSVDRFHSFATTLIIQRHIGTHRNRQLHNCRI